MISIETITIDFNYIWQLREVEVDLISLPKQNLSKSLARTESRQVSVSKKAHKKTTSTGRPLLSSKRSLLLLLLLPPCYLVVVYCARPLQSMPDAKARIVHKYLCRFFFPIHSMLNQAKNTNTSHRLHISYNCARMLRIHVRRTVASSLFLCTHISVILGRSVRYI